MSETKKANAEGRAPPCNPEPCNVCGRQACLAQMPGVGVTDEMEIECWRLGYERLASMCASAIALAQANKWIDPGAQRAMINPDNFKYWKKP